MNKMELLRDQLYYAAVPMSGNDMSDRQALELVSRSKENNKFEHFIVMDWLWIDIVNVPVYFIHDCEKYRMMPALLIAREVVYSSLRPILHSTWTHSGLLFKQTDECFCYSSDAGYLRLDDGWRAEADFEVIQRLFK